MLGKILVFFFPWPMFGSFGIVPEVSGLGDDHFILIANGLKLGIEGRQVPAIQGVNRSGIPYVDEVGSEELLEGISEGFPLRFFYGIQCGGGTIKKIQGKCEKEDEVFAGHDLILFCER